MATSAQAAHRFRVILPAEVAGQAKSYSGRLFVFLTRQEDREPRRGPNWFHPEPFFGVEVTAMRLGESRVIDDAADGFPAKLSEVAPGRYRAQALLDHDLDHHNPGAAPGNLYSEVVEIDLDPANDGTTELVLDQAIEPADFDEAAGIQEIWIESPLLTQFHGRPMRVPCAVALPESYERETDRRYPVIYSVPGFGGSHREALLRSRRDEGEVAFIRVYLTGECKWGHHVFADSATNGPRGSSLVREVIPHIDKTFRTVGASTGRFVTGHSSGGWSSLWLQVTHPGVFGGVWSTAPDPVDFRDFQRINLYARPSANVFVDEQGARRPLARGGDEPALWFDSFSHMDDVIKRGGQLRSFEAVFSPRGADGEPVRLWDRKTGEVDPQVARAWEAYDINLILRRNWQSLGPHLAGKLHIWTGELDTFYLEGAVKLLRETLQELESDAEVVIVPERNHANLLTRELRATIRAQMAETFLKHHALKVGS